MAPPFARGFTLPPEGCTPDEIVTVCAWCPELNILNLPRKSTDLVMIVWHAGEIRAYKNDAPMYASHGICPEHRQKMLGAQAGPCGAQKDSFTCNRSLGHAGEHWQENPNGGKVGWSNEKQS
jgi:hypothetical protein